MSPQSSLEALALKVTTVAGALYVAVEVVIALVSRSQSVLLDAVFDTAGVVLTFVSVRLLPLINAPPSERRPFGYAQAEPVFLVIKGLTMGTLVAVLFVEAVQRLFHGGNVAEFDLVALFELSDGLIDVGVVVFLLWVQKTVKTPIFRLEVKTWIVDALVSGAMAAAFFFALVVSHTPWAGLAPYVDPAVVVLLSLYVAHVPLQAIVEGVGDLVLLAPSKPLLERIRGLVRGTELVGVTSSRLEVIKTGRKYWIQVSVVPNDETVSLDHLGAVQRSLDEGLARLKIDARVQVIVEGKADPGGPGGELLKAGVGVV